MLECVLNTKKRMLLVLTVFFQVCVPKVSGSRHSASPFVCFETLT
jgi:hypothetical protein